jgi:hypothetical protein
MTTEEQTTIQHLIDTSKTCVDLKWKLGKYVATGDLSFLGSNKKELQEKIKKAIDEDN